MSVTLLPINTKKETRLSFHLSTILQNNIYPWFYEKYINLIIHGDREIIIDFINNKIDDSYREYMEERIIYAYEDVKDKKDIIQYLKESINKSFYSYIWLDKYNLYGNEYYHADHFAHTVLVYGYDDIDKKIYCLDFSSEKGIYVCICPYTDFTEAFVNCVHYIEFGGNLSTLSETITSYRIKKDIFVLPFNLDRFLSELHDYIYSEINNENGRYLYFNTTNISYGMSVYDRLIHILENILLNDDFRNYISFKTLSDFDIHKEYLYDRLSYIKEKYVLSLDCIQMINEYKCVVDLLHRAKALNLKYNIKDGEIAASFSYNKIFIKKFIEILNDVKAKEQEILSFVYDELKRSPILKTEQKNILNQDEYVAINDDNALNITTLSPQLAEKLLIVSSNNIRQNMEIIIDNKNSFTISANQYRITNKYSYEFTPQTINNIKIRNGDGSPPDLSKLDIRIFKLPAFIECNHDICRLFSCKYVGNILENNTDSVFELIGSDPNITYDIKFNADIAKYIYIKYSVKCDSQTAQLFFLNINRDTLLEEYSKIFTISPYDEKREYIIDMSDNPEWRGIIRMVRFDPVSYDNISDKGECSIEYLKISGEKPVYEAKKDYCCTQGVNGWSYHIFNNHTTYREMIFNHENNVWKAANNESVCITDTTQSSCAHIASVRRWTCPSEGKYKVEYEITPESSMNTGNDRYSQFIFRRNHKVIEKFIFDNNSQSALKYENNFILETGEVLGFEFYNQNENTIEIINIRASIIKTED